MIAQKVVDAKQPEQPGCAFVTLPDPVAAASRTFSRKHIRSNFLREKLTKSKKAKKDGGDYDRGGLVVFVVPASGDVTMTFSVAICARNNSISLEIRSAPASRS